ncbi:MAG TPA: hypothetical protein VK464_18395 [Symbiobacteriaceae bacterium]|nr:hypothetical protein [Symbiobacteriaceae bacterium]
MSYDLFLFRPEKGEDHLVTLERILDTDLPETAAEAGRKRQLAAALKAAHPQLEEFPGEEDIEPDTPEGRSGIPITLGARTASMTLAYWHGGNANAQTAIDERRRYFKTCEREAGYVAFDAQLDRTIDLTKDQPNVLKAYLPGTHC